jgi:hypothetical protein
MLDRLVCACNNLVLLLRLHDVIHTEKKLTLVFEYCDQDLKKNLDQATDGMHDEHIKVHSTL